MKRLKLFIVAFMVVLLPSLVSFGFKSSLAQGPGGPPPNEAPEGFDNKTNGMLDQTEFDRVREAFDAVEDNDEGVGPVFNARSCGECHGNPVSGGFSQVAVLRAGHFDGTNFIEHPGGSLIHSRAIDARIQERVLDGNEVRAFRMSLSILGDGFVEAVDDNTLIAIANEQPGRSGGRIRGEAIFVPVEEAPGVKRVGRFGWKCQQASLLSFSGDAYLNEMGITTPLFPTENTSNGRSVAEFDSIADPDEADNDDLDNFAAFMRSSKAPARDMRLAGSPEGRAGQRTFDEIGCAVCHVPTMRTLPAGSLINGGMFRIPPALGGKTFHPFGDFLLHDVGTGDGIVQNGGPSTRNKVRTAPLWGLRTHNQYMHDGASLTLEEAILRHSGEAENVIAAYRALSRTQRRNLMAFLNSL